MIYGTYRLPGTVRQVVAAFEDADGREWVMAESAEALEENDAD